MTKNYKLNKLTLKFLDNKLENRFKDHYFEESKKPMRIAIIFAIFLFAIFGIPDIVKSNFSLNFAITLRYFIFLPFMWIVFFTSYAKFFKKLGQSLYSLTILLAGITVLYIAQLDFPDDKIHLFGLTVVIVYCFSFSKLDFKYATITALLILFTYTFTSYYLIYVKGLNSDNDFNSLAFFQLFYTFFVINGIMSSYSVEKLYRGSFLQRIEINDKNNELHFTNDKLNEQNKLISEQILELDELNKRLSDVNLELSEQFSELEILNDNEKKLNLEIILKNDNLAKLNNDLQDANLAKDKFFSIISHDIKNPLAAIRNYSEMLSQKDLNTAQRDELLNSMNKAIDFVLKLLDDLLTWSRSHSNRIDFKPELINFSDFINPIIEQMQIVANTKNISIDYVYNKIDVIADKNMLNTILRNLISNSIKFTNLCGKIKIDCSINNQTEIVISVKDNGIGMSEHILNKLFDISYHHSSKGTNDEKGTGFGLLLCKEFIEKHNGKIWVSSKINEGSEFAFTLSSK